MLLNGTLYIIFNPLADNGKASRRLGVLEARLRSSGTDFEIAFTRRPGHGIELAREAAGQGYAVIAAAGGDGTSNEVINGLMRARDGGTEPPPLAVLPVGRGNDFAYGVGVPDRLETACALFGDEPQSYLMDVGEVRGGLYPEGRFFGNGIGIGFDTIVGLEAAKARWARGFTAYAYGALKTFLAFPEPPEVKLRYDGQTVSVPSHQISVMNGRRMGGGFYMAPEASSGDGLLDLCMSVQRLNRRQMFGLILRYTKGSQLGHPAIRMERATELMIEAEAGALICHADGETVALEEKSLEVHCHPSALRVIGFPRGRVE
jgi:YegS/Rv2252/BmrU family lipid kinase